MIQAAYLGLMRPLQRVCKNEDNQICKKCCDLPNDKEAALFAFALPFSAFVFGVFWSALSQSPIAINLILWRILNK